MKFFFQAFRELQNFLQYLAPAVASEAEHHQTDHFKLRQLVSKVYLKLGEWYEELNGLTIDNLKTILTYYTHAKVS